MQNLESNGSCGFFFAYEGVKPYRYSGIILKRNISIMKDTLINNNFLFITMQFYEFICKGAIRKNEILIIDSFRNYSFDSAKRLSLFYERTFTERS